MRKVGKFRLLIIGVVLSVVFLFIAVRNVSLIQAWQALQVLDVRLMVFPAAIALANFSLRAWRWQELFPARARPGFSQSFRALTISFMANNLLPARAGDLARCLLVSPGRSVAGASVAIATLGVEKLLDGVALLCIVMYSCFIIPPPPWLSHLGVAGVAVFGGALIVFALLRWRCDFMIGVLRKSTTAVGAEKLGEKVAALLASFTEGLSAISSLGQIVVLAVQTMAIWVTEAGLIWVLARILHIDLSGNGAVVAAAILGLGLMIPAAPGALGTYEFFSTAGLHLMGVSAVPALALTLLLHGWVLVFNTAIGLLCMGLSGLSFSQLGGSTSRDEKTDIAVANQLL